MTDLVNLCMKSSSSNEPTKLRVDVVLGDTKCIRHVGQRQAPVGLQQLGVRLDLHFSHVIFVVGEHVPISFQTLLNFTQFLRKKVVIHGRQNESQTWKKSAY